MKFIITMIGLLFMLNSFAGWRSDTRDILNEYDYACDNSEVVVDQLIRNDSITGHVKGLPSEALDKFKMVFYVKTDHWYIHPFTYSEGQAEGLSYALLNANGEFKIKTTLRQVPASQMAAVLVPKPYKIYSQRWLLKPLFGIFGGILKYECNHTMVKGNGDFFTID